MHIFGHYPEAKLGPTQAWRRGPVGLEATWARDERVKMGYELDFVERSSGPINAIELDGAHGTMWGGSSNHGEDYGIGW